MAQVPATRGNSGGQMPTRREHPLTRLQRDFDMLMESLWGGPMSPAAHGLEPLRVWDFGMNENDKEIVVRAELPGFEEKEIDIQLDKDMLIIKAEKEQKEEGHEEYRNFYRAVTLPSGVNAEKAEACYRNGVLELHIPRAEGTQPRRIKVQKSMGQQPSGQAGHSEHQGEQGSNPEAASQGTETGK